MDFLKTLILKVFGLLKMCPIFVGSVHDFGKSDDDIILGKKCFFPIHESVVSCPTCTQKSWMVSCAAASATKMSR